MSKMVVVSSLIFWGLIPNTTVAQIIPDSSLGAENSVVDTNGNRDTINGGAIRDANLFHSFQEFNVEALREAYFTNPDGINNIFSRVTGNNISDIQGVLGVLGNANLYLINPNGILFGENARLDVNGSFFATTADSVLFDKGFEFSAANPDAPPLLTIDIPIGLRFRDNPGDIVNQSTANNGNGLEVSVGENITLVGGNINLAGGNIFAPGGRVELGGLSAAGEISIDSDGSLSFPNEIERADITLTNGAEVDVRAAGGGSIIVSAGNLELFGGELGGSILRAGIAANLGSAEAQGGNITINATDNITVSQESLISNRIEESGVGNSGDINITSTDLSLAQGSKIDSIIRGKGNGGDINIKASDTISIDGKGQGVLGSGIFGRSSFSKGNLGEINITTTDLFLTRGGSIGNNHSGRGDAGGIIIKAFGNISIDGEGQGVLGSDISSRGSSEGINITTTNLSLTRGGQVRATILGQGNAVAVNLEASNTISVDGANSGIFSRGSSEGINITTTNLSLTRGGRVETNSGGLGDTGGIIIRASDTISVDGANSGIFSQIKRLRSKALDILRTAVGKGIVNSGGDLGENKSGYISITTTNLSLTRGGRVDASILSRKLGDEGTTIIEESTFGQGDAGDIRINASGTISVDGEDRDGLSSGIFSIVEGEGDSRGINITTANLYLTRGGVINASTEGQGNAGGIRINASGNISVDGETKAGWGSGIFSTVASTGIGDAGGINITTDNLSLSNNVQISVESLGQGNANDIFIQAKSIALSKGSSLLASTQVETGGNITLRIAENVTLRDSSTISARALENANGGNVNIDAEFIIAFPNQNNDIIANAEQGTGGKIDITAEGLFGIEERSSTPTNQTNDIDASSEFGLDGQITITRPDVDPTSGLLELTQEVVDPAKLIAQNVCTQTADSEFVDIGKGGLPQNPQDRLAEDFIEVGLVAPIITSSEATEPTRARIEIKPKRTRKPPAQGWIFHDNGIVELVAYNPDQVGEQRTWDNYRGCQE